MVETQLYAHDVNQLEVKLGYRIEPNRSTQRYRVETFLFLPRTLGITPTSYSKSTFYEDTGAFMRLSTPRVSLAELGPEGTAPLYTELERALRQVLNGSTQDAVPAVRLIKVLACVLKNSLRAETEDARKGLEEAVAQTGGSLRRDLLSVELDGLADRISGAVTRLEELNAHAGDPSLPQRVRGAWEACDEFVSLEAEEACTTLVAALDALRSKSSTGLDGPRERFAKLAVECYQHRRARGYGSFVEAGEENEEILLRHRHAKRAMSSVLYLEVLRSESGAFWRNLAGMLAAAVAMLFAVITTLWATSRFEMFSVAFVTIAVLSYVVKDRIKDLGKGLLGRRLSPGFDREVVVRDGELGMKLGTVRERFHICDSTQVEPGIASERLRHHGSAMAADARPESVICWTKEVSLSSAALAKHPLGVGGLTDIVRLNFDRLRARMSAPYEERNVVSPDSLEVRTVRCASIHHVNMLLRLSWDQGRQVRTQFVRVVLDQRGIKRVEPLYSHSKVTSSGAALSRPATSEEWG